MKREFRSSTSYPGEDFPDSFYTDIKTPKSLTRGEEKLIAIFERNIYRNIWSTEEGLSRSKQALSDKCFTYYSFLLNVASCIHANDYKGITLDSSIFYAVNQDHVAIAAVLLRFGSNVNLTEHSTNSGLLHICKSPDMVDLLVKFGVDINQKTLSGKSALHNVSNAATAEALLALGLSVDSRDNAGGTVLHNASSFCMAQFFIKKGVDVNATNRFGYSAIHRLVAYGNWETVLMLLVAGADYQLQGRDGMQV